MLPFDSLLFFYILTIALIPAVLLGLTQKRLKYYCAAVNLVMIALIYSSPVKIITLACFWVGEYLLTVIWQRILVKHKKRPLLWLFTLLSLAPLIYIKVSGLFGSGWFTLSLLGVSYMTFRAIGVIIESYDGLIKKTGILEDYYFILFFPSLSSGPIDRRRRFKEDMDKRYTRSEYIELLRGGVWRLFTGALYNFVIAKLVYTYLVSPLPETFWGNAAYAVTYTVFLFFNFAGYSLMAIGASYIMGIKVPENFNMPFLAHDLKDFWSRWHISLSTWLRDFVYTRFVMSSLKGKWFKNKHVGSYLGYLITFMAMGLWHGFELRYILYGLYHGLLLCLNDYLDNNAKWYKKGKKKSASC